MEKCTPESWLDSVASQFDVLHLLLDFTFQTPLKTALYLHLA